MAAPAQTASVVVNTLDRADSLADLLQACTQLTHPDFEVIVVAGPCTDHTYDVLAQWEGRVVVRSCPEKNLSMSRNIGIAAAAGDVVAFIDDDGIPEPTWLEEICAGYEDESVGAVGGIVYNHTGHEFQVRFMLSDRLGNTQEFEELPPGDFSFPGSSRYPSMLGCNSSFRKAALLEVGGFDEEYDYYLDETDVCARIVDAGWVIRNLDGAPVHHKYLPSGIRTQSKVVADNTSVVKNKVYFSAMNGAGHWPWTDIMADNVRFAAGRREEMHAKALAQDIDGEQLARGLSTIDDGWALGLAAAVERKRRLLSPDRVEERALLPFDTCVAADRMRVVLVTRGFPPEQQGGVGRYFSELASHLARRGHEVRVVTSGTGHDTVDLVEGVWVHRVVDRPEQAHSCGPPIPDALLPRVASVASEVLRIDRERPVDLVFASVWDVEFAEVLTRSSIPVICGYTTPFSIVRSNQEEAIAVSRDVADSIEALEEWAHSHVHGVQANGLHIVDAVKAHSGVEMRDDRLFVVPLGSDATEPRRGPTSQDVFTIAFVGRFERRKGIDLLLEAIPEVYSQWPQVRFRLVGDDSLPDGHGSTFRASFEAAHPELVEADVVEFNGAVDDSGVIAVLADADVAVLPSRFESFGLVYLEAMAAGVPVVALRGSGAEEVIEDGVSGILCDPSAASLAKAIIGLGQDHNMMAKMGRQAREAFESNYTAEAMTQRFIRMFETVRTARPGAGGWEVAAGHLVDLPDGHTGYRLAPGDRCSVPIGDGASTLVLVGTGNREESRIDVVADDVVVASRSPGAGCFDQVKLPTGVGSAEVHNTGSVDTCVAAVVSVDPGAAGLGVGPNPHPA